MADFSGEGVSGRSADGDVVASEGAEESTAAEDGTADSGCTVESGPGALGAGGGVIAWSKKSLIRGFRVRWWRARRRKERRKGR